MSIVFRSLIWFCFFLIAHLLIISWLRKRLHLHRYKIVQYFVVLLFIGILIAEPIFQKLSRNLKLQWLYSLYGASKIARFTILITALSVCVIELMLFIARVLTRTRKNNQISLKNENLEDLCATSNRVQRRDILATIGGGSVLTFTGSALGWGALRTRFDIETVEIPVFIPRLPSALDGFSIVQVSDIHVGPFLYGRHLEHSAEIVQRLKPDLVVMTGDLLHLELDFLQEAVAWVAQLGVHAHHGVAAIAGNHEYYAGRDRVLNALRRANVQVLFNESVTIAKKEMGGFGLIGVDDLYGTISKLGPGPKVSSALSRLLPEQARILLCHQPTYFENAASFGFDLMLSGHTHGGQIQWIGTIPTQVMYQRIQGLWQINSTRLYVNRGLGTSGPPSRIGVRPEITKIVLVSK